jgi:dolichol kinase
MSTSFAPTSQALALDLYGLLRELDPNHWCGEIESCMADRVAHIRERIANLCESVDAHSPGPALEAVGARLTELVQIIESHKPQTDLPARWEEFRQGMVPAYERYAASLRHLDIHVPSLRPTNYARNIYHIANAIFCVLCLRFLSEMSVLIVATSMLVVAWGCEIGRRIVPRLNDFLMKLMGKFAHPHEAWRVNSATWYVTACVILALLWNLQAASVGIVVLGFADPAAAIMGRRYGRHQLINGRTLEGTGVFIVVGTITAWLWLVLGWGLGAGLAFEMALVGATAGGIAELFSRRIDDNLSIPVAAALGALAILAAG